jgi:hypothetical protein
MLTDWGVDTLGMGRHLELGYFIFTDPLVIIAAALLIVNLTDLQRRRWTYPIGIALIAAHVVLSQVEPVKNDFRTKKVDVVCEQQSRLPRLVLPFCPPRPALPQ